MTVSFDLKSFFTNVLFEGTIDINLERNNEHNKTFRWRFDDDSVVFIKNDVLLRYILEQLHSLHEKKKKYLRK